MIRDCIHLSVQQDLLVISESAERCPVRCNTAGIHRQPQLIRRVLQKLVESPGSPVLVAKTSDRIERFERKAGRIDRFMTTRTDGAVSMRSQLFTNGGRPARVGLNTAYVRWRWRRWPAK